MGYGQDYEGVQKRAAGVATDFCSSPVKVCAYMHPGSAFSAAALEVASGE